MNISGESILILLSTYNGEKYLRNQIDSIINQSYTNWQLLLRDDLSTDNTSEIIGEYEKKDSRIRLIRKISGKNIGANLSFNILLNYAIKNRSSNYFMFADQDDVWFPNKIELSVNTIQSITSPHITQDSPLLLFTNKIITDEKLNVLGNSYYKYQSIQADKIHLNQQLLQNVPTACTMIFNRTLAELASPIPQKSVMHDHWISLVAASFGKIYYIDEPTMYYRQHSSNVFGAKKYGINLLIQKYKQGIPATKKKFYLLCKQAEQLLETHRDKFTKEQIKMLEDFSKLPYQSWFIRRKILIKHKIYKSGLLRNLAMFCII